MANTVVRLLLVSLFIIANAAISEPEKVLLFGDTHLHTSNSFDAYLMFNRDAGPDAAFRWARGMPVVHPYTRARVQIGTPLDFLVISDHAEFLGVMRGIDEGTAEFDQQGWWDSAKRWLASQWLRRVLAEDTFNYENFFAIAPPLSTESIPDPVLTQANLDYLANVRLASAEITNQKTWQEITESADRHNDPGNFTALIGWEWSSTPDSANLHRVIFTPDDASVANQFKPFSFLDSQYPEDLWRWLEEQNQAIGARFISIPHNSNGSKGHMFDVTSLRGKPIDAEYARLRSRWEPVVEITQIKGDSETTPSLSPNDEFADFEYLCVSALVADGKCKSDEGDYVRSALKRGLSIQREIGFNPFSFGVVGSTDSHTGLASAEEANFWGKVAVDSLPEYKENDLIGEGVNGWSMSASGLAAVWAEDNTREAIFSAFQRREVYATTGPMIKVKVLARWVARQQVKGGQSQKSGRDFPLNRAQAVVMGGQLKPPLTAISTELVPSFYIEAMRDPKSGSLDRVQMVKGWIDAEGNSHEKVYDMAWSGERVIDSDGKLEAVGNSVDIASGHYDDSIGSDSLTVTWSDPDFDEILAAFYYVRVLEIPTPRHSLLDAIALNEPLEEKDGPATIQERAYTSAIWYTPANWQQQ